MDANLPERMPATLWLESVDSTQRVAGELIAQNDRRYNAVCARHQTAGRGRKGATWYDEPDTCLLVSLILWDTPLPEPVGVLGLVAALAVVELVSDFLKALGAAPERLALKYPNDVLLDQRKLAGVLVEIVQGVPIVGIGVNVAQSAFPPELEARAISLYQSVGAPDALQFAALRADWVARLWDAFQRWDAIRRGSPHALYENWVRWDSTAGRAYRVMDYNGVVGTAIAIEPDFRLRLRLPDGQEVCSYFVESLL
ncbi:MAG: biotin--[acetyl-CoA-carboxylase] ligase [Fimbriimonadales bacterium]|jgi:BirA family biotin operon repressor/biotin-[acetyl-CoA-carboxylase] ligase|nr:biotin--[acetyl-CoA-carboxylase] ligase [Fimbriimonadales bacterium]GBC90830.1 Bifunctional ligase/repressor BirA [bacterium HR14]GIV12986.1 MAG: biotin--[acetyl-CoA-carboxylase] ligase [Fimbriimonadales bacterium]CUU10075.1 BirA family transcriptional regulator, biotin operon repressor / biotin-[acetyl-CoA-carboxylase] ligase [Armatimonadetes bacterium GBS]CUU34773.1 BirA family transcriptional regulator, biotin operon repressor / biotin-[acetyl-CoA-carboxylase] ligase [Armatimonadetes bact